MKRTIALLSLLACGNLCMCVSPGFIAERPGELWLIIPDKTLPDQATLDSIVADIRDCMPVLSATVITTPEDAVMISLDHRRTIAYGLDPALILRQLAALCETSEETMISESTWSVLVPEERMRRLFPDGLTALMTVSIAGNPDRRIHLRDIARIQRTLLRTSIYWKGRSCQAVHVRFDPYRRPYLPGVIRSLPFFSAHECEVSLAAIPPDGIPPR